MQLTATTSMQQRLDEANKRLIVLGRIDGTPYVVSIDAKNQRADWLPPQEAVIAHVVQTDTARQPNKPKTAATTGVSDCPGRQLKLNELAKGGFSLLKTRLLPGEKYRTTDEQFTIRTDICTTKCVHNRYYLGFCAKERGGCGCLVALAASDKRKECPDGLWAEAGA